MSILESKYLYLGLMIFSIGYPLAQSFEWRLRLFKKWKAIFSGIFIMCCLFIPWDIWFTEMGVWWFRDDYITGLKIFGLPLEEWLFFIIVPYACVFIYEVLNYFVTTDYFGRIAKSVFFFISVTLICYGLVYANNYYTAITFLLTGLATLILAIKNPVWIGRFLFMYLVSWLPFLLINGALTGNFTDNPVVNYNPDEIIGLRITTIPIEDSVYNLLMLLIVISIYEKKKG